MKENLGFFLSKRAGLSPRAEGFIAADGELRLSFHELNQRSNQAADLLRARGVDKGDRVALLLTNGAAYVEAFFAIAKIGGVVVPLNRRLTAEELAFILEDSGASVLVFGAEFAGVVSELHARPALKDSLASWLCAQEGDPPEGRIPKFALDYVEQRSQASQAEPELAAEGDDDLYIMYTSGTTGRPKGAVHTHRTAMWGCLTINATADLRANDRYIVALPLFHVGALTPMTTNVYRGATSIVMRAFDAERAWRVIERERATTMLAVPAMLNFMLQVDEKRRGDFSSLRWIMSGAAPVPVTLIRAFAELGIEIHQVYGLTETCGPGCLIGSADALERAGSTGKAFFHTDVRVVDENGNDVAPGEVGEVRIRGPHVMKGYWRRPEATAEAFAGDWFLSGDLATVDADGFVTIQDRKKDMIISGGENVYPAEIEDVLLSHPSVRDAAVIGLPSRKWGESPLAVIVRSDLRVGEADLLEHCERRLARFKLPKAVEFVDEIPRNPAGKILKRILRERFPGPASD